MKIEAFLLAWNEIDMVKLVVQHHQKFCDKITILDNYSTDGTPEWAAKNGCEIKQFGTKFFDDQMNMEVKNNVWKGSDADFVIVADFDEALFCADPCLKDVRSWLQYFYDEEKPTIIKTIGWQIMSDTMPEYNLTETLNGYRFDNYSKNICFDPKRILEINYNPGAHKISPVGDVVYSEDSLYVLHYKHIGGVQRTIDRYREYQPRMSKNNRRKGYGSHYWRTEQSIREEWAERMLKSKPLI